MKILYYDYSRQNLQILERFKNEISFISSLKSNHELESYVEEFEKRFAEYCKAKYAIGTNSGTSALQLSLFAIGIKKDDEVIVPANTYISTALAVSNLGAKPIFCDVCENDFNIDPSKIESKITEKTKAIIPVHMYGHPANMEPILKMAKKHNLNVIEDAAHSHRAEYRGKKTGSLGDLGCFSFHASKNLGIPGDAGIITTDDIELYTKIKKLEHPDNNTEEIRFLGRTPWRLDAIHAALLRIKLPFLDKWSKEKGNNAKLYDEYIKNPAVKKPTGSADVKHVYRDYVIRINKRDELKNALYGNGIETAVRYPIPLHITKTYLYLGYRKGDFPVAEILSKEILSLPIFIGIKKSEIIKVANHINTFK